ncbi:hypothetical protein ACIBAG_43925 [Streptomyces sp. NPDC051243]|uniref:hypothetical protein n=1 Tax=Streptomyces sp. NPDC051243 TaxID=3365646 RepID=UPI0037A5E398
MLRTIKAAGIATAAALALALALTSIAATPATASVSAQAPVTVAHHDCDHAEVDARGLGFQPGQTIIVEHTIRDDFGGPSETLPSDTLTVKADGTWATPTRDGGGAGTRYIVTVKDTRGTQLDTDDSYCGIW